MSEALVQKLTVAVAQVETRFGALEQNTDRHIAVIHEARAQGVTCLLFPELSLTGRPPSDALPAFALDADHPMVKAIVKASGPIMTTFGLVEEGPAAQFFNSAYTVGGGRISHIHRKISRCSSALAPATARFAQGRYLETFVLAKRWRAATLLGSDMWNPALVHLASVKGTTCLLAPTASAEADSGTFDSPSGWAMVCRYSAMMHAMPLLFANRVGVEDGRRHWGNSRIIDPFGEILADAGEGEGMAVAELDFGHVREARFALPTQRDSELELVHRELGRLQDLLGVPEAVRRPSR